MALKNTDRWVDLTNGVNFVFASLKHDSLPPHQVQILLFVVAPK